MKTMLRMNEKIERKIMIYPFQLLALYTMR